MFLALAIAIVVGSMMFSLHKARWVSLEKEIKAARYELTRARTSLATILEMVEERLALTEQQRTPAVLDSSVPPAPQLAAAAPVAEASAEISIFKAQRPRPVQ